MFNPAFWAHHLLVNSKRNKELNRQSIGIEIVSEGALKMVNGILKAFDGKTVFTGKYIDNVKLWRDYRYFASYEIAQIKSLYQLCAFLCEQYSIPKKCIPQEFAATQVICQILLHNIAPGII